MLGALGAGYVEGILTGAFQPPHSWFQFDIGRQRLAVVAPPSQNDSHNAPAESIWLG